MSLDERVRVGLRRSAEAGGLDADAVFDGVVAAHRRGRLRTRVVRQAVAVAVAFTLFVGVAFFVSWRNTPARYRSVAAVALAPQGTSAFTLADPVRDALAPATRRATLLAAHLAPDDAHVSFRATSTGPHTISLTATAPSPRESALVTGKWVSVLTTIRRADARRQLIKSRNAVRSHVETLRKQLQAIDAKLAKLDPKTYGSAWKYDATNRAFPPRSSTPPPPVPEQGSVKELNLAFERIQLKSQLEKYARQAPGDHFGALAPLTLTQPIGQKPPVRVDATPSATGPALIAWAAGLALILAAAFVIYRRRARAILHT